MGLSQIKHVPRHLTEIRRHHGDYITTERSLNSQIEQLNSLLGDPFNRKWDLGIPNPKEKIKYDYPRM